MIILGIETSCDETAAALVKDGSHLLAHAMYSQVSTHVATGGVVPEVAAREHAVKIVPIIESVFKKARLSPKDIDAVAVTQGPGLVSSLLVGTNAASVIAAVLKKPLIPVNHIEGHIYANCLDAKPKFPVAVLTVSGGHNELLIWKDHGSYKFLGSTLDDAAGEAFDKVARLLGLEYPGGPAIQKIASEGDSSKFPLPKPFLTPWNPSVNKFNWDFSFSGLKTAVLYLLRDHTRLDRPDKNFIENNRAHIAASFQESVCEVLSEKLLQAAMKYNVREIHLAGGVSANSRLREMVLQKMLYVIPGSDRGSNANGKRSPIKSGMTHHINRQLSVVSYQSFNIHWPSDITLCTDNAIMIAVAGYYKFRHYPRHYFDYKKPVVANPNLQFKNWK